MKVLLVQPPLPQMPLPAKVKAANYVPLGLLYLAATLEQHRVDVALLDMEAESARVEDIPMWWLQTGYDVVGITSVTTSYPNAILVSKLVKQISPTTTVIMGGPHVTFTDEEVVRDNPSVDAVVRGEGEQTLLEIVQAIDAGRPWHGVLGVTSRFNGEIIKSPSRPPIQDLNSIPFPARHLGSPLYHPSIVTSRGCVMSCTFCVAGQMGGGAYRVRSPENVVSELRILDGQKHIVFADNTFTGHPKKANEVVQAIADASLDITWDCEMRVNTATLPALRQFREAGCRVVQFGVESGSDDVLRSIKKGITQRQIVGAVEAALQAELDVSCSITIGHPHDTRESVRQTIELMRKLINMGAMVSPTIVTPFPGTALYNDPDAFGIRIRDRDWERYSLYRPIIDTQYLSAQEIGELFMEVFLEAIGTITPRSGEERRISG